MLHGHVLVSCIAAGLLVAVQLAPAPALGTVITFENTPSGGTPIDDAPLSRTDAYTVGGVSVSFGFDTDNDGVADTDAIFERRGSDANNGFFSVFGPEQFDTERPTSPHSLGDFFLRQPTAIGALPGTFVISYSSDVSALSGEIWDIDAGTGFEQWRVSAFDAVGSLVDSIDSPMGIDTNDVNSMDSLAWVFSLQGANIRRVEFEFIGTTSIVGLAFNNYNATAVPEPTSIALTAIALAAAGLTRRNRYSGGS